MTLKTNPAFRYLVITGPVFFVIYLLDYTPFYSSFLIFVWLVLLGFIILVITVKAVFTSNRPALMLGLSMIVGVTLIEISKLEIFKSRKVLEAVFTDDFSSIHIILRENQKFEVVSKYGLYWGADETYDGDYEIEGEKIYFKSKPLPAYLLTNPVMIQGDKIYQSNGYSAIESAHYFKVEYRDSSYFRNQ